MCSLFMVTSYFSDISDQQEISKKKKLNKITHFLFHLVSLYFYFFQSALCSVISAGDPTLMSIDR